MAAILQVGLRSFRNLLRKRTVSTFVQQRLDEEVHALKTMVTWRYISLFVAIPTVLLTAYNAYTKEMAHMAHVEEHGRPEYVRYGYLCLMKKPFPMGDGKHPLIYNPKVNALPED